MEDSELEFEDWFASKGEWHKSVDAYDMLRAAWYDCKAYMPSYEAFEILDTVISVMQNEYGD